MIHVAGSSYLAVVNPDVSVDIVAVDTGLPVQFLKADGAREAAWSGNSSHLAVLSITSSSHGCTIRVYVCTETIALSLSQPQWTLVKVIPAPMYSKDRMSWYQYSHLSFSYPLACLTVYQTPVNNQTQESEGQNRRSNDVRLTRQKQHQQWSVYDSVFVYDATSASASSASADHLHHHQHKHQQWGRHMSSYRMSRVVLLDVLVGQFDELQVRHPLHIAFSSLHTLT